MECNVCREALSARLDGEQEPSPVSATDEHLNGCFACQQWWAQASALTRSIRVRPLVETPDLVTAVLSAAPAMSARGGRARWWRLALGVVAIAQIVLAAAQLFGLDFGMVHSAPSGMAGMPGMSGNMSAHLFNESTAWNLAVGLGLLWAALRPRTAGGMVPVLAVFVAVLIGFVVHDLVAGNVTVSRVASHGLLVAGLVLLLVVYRRFGRVPIPSPDHGFDVDDEWASPTPAAKNVDNPGDSSNGKEPLRPAGRHAA